jgi:hypothetical protein
MRRDHNGKFSRVTAKSNSGLPNGAVGISADWKNSISANEP